MFIEHLGLWTPDLERLKAYYEVYFVILEQGDAKKGMFVGSFNFWDGNKNPMTFDGQAWFCEVSVDPGMVPFKFIVNGKYILDTNNPGSINDGGYINSVIEVF